ncbi:kinase-like domain-containing protein [Fomes fomentarius]|nr:kinase-like domain-containing protein [Fomes fomentarius]
MACARRNYARLSYYEGQQKYVAYVLAQSYTIGPGDACDLVIHAMTGLHSAQSVYCSIVRRHSHGSDSKLQCYIQCMKGVSIRLNDRLINDTKLRRLETDDVLLFPCEGNRRTNWFSVTFEELAPDSVHAKYKIIKQLGAGGYGTVYSAESLDTGVVYAMKIMSKPRRLPGPSRRDPIVNEVEILKTANHPNIVKFDCAFFEPRCLYLIMELMTNGSLDTLIFKEKRLVECEARMVASDVCSAVSYLHSMDIVHRDIKPGNILVKCRNPLSVKVSDFGLAKVVDQGTDIKTFCGTPYFMAPEISETIDKGYSEKVDMWAIGVTLFNTLSGLSPFTRSVDNTDLEQLYRVEWDYLPAETSREVTHLLSRMLSMKPECRPTCVEVLDSLWFRSPLSVHAPPPPSSFPVPSVEIQSDPIVHHESSTPHRMYQIAFILALVLILPVIRLL